MNPELLCFPPAADVPDSDLGKGFKRQLPYRPSLLCVGAAYFIYLAKESARLLGQLYLLSPFSSSMPVTT